MRDFKHTMDLLVKAYFEDELQHDFCNACAVGTICGGMEWGYLFITPAGRKQLVPNDSEAIKAGIIVSISSLRPNEKEIVSERKGYATRLIEKTGYSKEELMRIEYAFESAPKGESGEDWMFNGLMAVLEVLADIHEVDFSGQRHYEERLNEIFATRE